MSCPSALRSISHTPPSPAPQRSRRERQRQLRARPAQSPLRLQGPSHYTSTISCLRHPLIRWCRAAGSALPRPCYATVARSPKSCPIHAIDELNACFLSCKPDARDDFTHRLLSGGVGIRLGRLYSTPGFSSCLFSCLVFLLGWLVGSAALGNCIFSSLAFHFSCTFRQYHPACFIIIFYYFHIHID
ncbi:hypothetical protein BKA56DRAFT_298444 [Ilyonectria sp. MPI-CAGE-AT-0026]|nr:hypothetical protein BKA56DRAFT_298444 [Ilyonectria sp. MPI-CAGE-AT-0026]